MEEKRYPVNRLTGCSTCGMY